MTKKALHKPVMVAEALNYLQVKTDRWYIDATFGRGGHTQAILNKAGKVIAFDQDQEAIDYGNDTFGELIAQGRLKLIKSNFLYIATEIKKFQSYQAETALIDGIIFDFGTSTDQIRAPHRGFSFDNPASPLDMRMDQDLGVTATDLLAILSEKQLADLFLNYGGEVHAKKIAKQIIRYQGQNREKKITTVGQLLEAGFKDIPKARHLHPATKVFQALRIAVNDELNCIFKTLPEAYQLLNNQGKIVTISFHQGEDGIVKNTFKHWEAENKGEILTKKPIKPSETELTNNHQARSAKLRAFKKN